MKLAISQDLEHCLLHALIIGLLPEFELKNTELTREGQAILEATEYLRKRREPPWSFKTVLAAAVDVMGGDRDVLYPYMKKVVFADAGMEAKVLMSAIRQKQSLMEFINKAGEQLASGDIDTMALVGLLEKGQGTELTPLAATFDGKLPALPSGPLLQTLPKLSNMVGGLFGFCAIGGKAGAGKSTLAIQFALEMARTMPVLYYDFEQGPQAILAHLGVAFNGDVAEVKRVTERLYIRDTMRTLSTDLGLFKPPALIVVDSIQKVPTSIEHRRSGLDVWVHRFEALKRRGYTVLAVSELNRSGYDKMAQESYKETGELEYSADVGLQIKQIDKTHDIEIHCVKNRHRPNLGHLLDLYRVQSWLFSETFKKGVTHVGQ